MDFLDPIIENLGINWKLFLAQLVNFGIVFFLMKKYAFAPIQKALSEREKKIAQGLEDSQKAKTEFEMAEQKYEEKIKEARLEANKIIAESQTKREEIINKAKEEAENISREMIKGAKQEIIKEREKMFLEVKKEVIDLTFLTASRFLEKELNEQEDKKIISDLIK